MEPYENTQNEEIIELLRNIDFKLNYIYKLICNQSQVHGIGWNDPGIANHSDNINNSLQNMSKNFRDTFEAIERKEKY